MYPNHESTAAGADLLRQLHIAIIRLDDKVDNLAHRMSVLEKTLGDHLKDHEERIRALESRPYVAPATVWKVLGFCVSVLALAATVIGLLVK